MPRQHLDEAIANPIDLEVFNMSGRATQAVGRT